MWIAEFKVWHEGSPLLPLSKQFDVHVFSQYLNSFEERGVPKIMRLAKFWGRDKARAIAQLKAHADSEIIYAEGDLVFFAQKAVRSFHSVVADKTVFFVGPIVEEKGFQWWRVGAAQKSHLTALLSKIQQQKGYATAELVSIKNTTPMHLTFSGGFDEFSSLDLQWWKAALEHGYYEYPRKIGLLQLSKKLGVAYSTLKDHLRKTENALMKRMGGQV